MSILMICQDAALELSLVTPTSVVTTSDETARKLNRHLTKVCKALAKRYDWQTIRREQTFTTTQAAAQANAIPSDFLRFVQNSMFNRSLRRKVLGPLTPTQWQAFQSSLATPTWTAFIQRGNAVQFVPVPPAAGETIAYEYITKNIGATSGGTPLATFTGDDDEPYFDAELLTLGVIYSFRQAERLDYAEEMRQFELAYADLVKQDGGRRLLDMDSGFGGRGSMIPDTLEFDTFNSEFTDAFA